MNLCRVAFWTLLGMASCELLSGAELGNSGASAKSKQNHMTTPPELKAEVWAGPSLLANPVSFAFDEKGRMFMTVSYRQGTGVPDNRAHPYWLEDDIAAQTIDDRLKKYEKWQHRTPLTTFTNEAEWVKLISDSNGDGVADLSVDFAGPFNDILDGTAAGLLAKDGEIWMTSIPHVWKLRDEDGDNKAEVTEKVFTGFGVRDAFRGHDLHGLVLGPDGRIYFSMADRGYNIKLADGKVLRDPMDDGRGAVFRCWPDGSGLEVYARGLRNPQELAFDAFGNLFTVDNNGDSGDRARLVQVVEGGDSGWCMTYQYGTPAIVEGKYGRGPWDAEGLWHLQNPEQAAWIIPPVAHITDGPSGFVYYPGVTAIGDEKYADSFFICDFKGAAANSGVWNFRVERSGAGFKLSQIDKFVWNVLATDCDFAPDGRFYVSDFIDGWTGVNEGYVFAVADPNQIKSDKVQEVKRLFEDGFAKRDLKDLANLLNHADMRVRLRAQYALVEKGSAEALEILANQAKQGKTVAARLHGIWGLGALRQQVKEAVTVLLPLLNDEEVNIRSQVAKTLGDLNVEGVSEALLARLEKEEAASVQAELAIALRKRVKNGKEKALQLAVKLLAGNADKDVVLRHAASMLLSGLDDRKVLAALHQHEHRSVRMGAVLALRRLQAPEVAEFLADADVQIVTEAARAIYDMNIVDALPKLAELLKHEKTISAPQALTLRAVNAAYRSGNAEVLAHWAANEKAPAASRREALYLLAHWAEPSRFERVLGFHRPLQPRDAAPALAAINPHLEKLLGNAGKVADEALRTALTLQAKLPRSLLVSLLKDDKRDASTRAEALRLLAQEKGDALNEGLNVSSADSAPAELRIVAAELLADRQEQRAVQVLLEVIQKAELPKRQSAVNVLAALAANKTPARDAILELLDELVQDKVPAGLRLDLLEAAATLPAAKEKLAQWQARYPATDMYASFDVCLEGGDKVRGKDLFANHTAAQCMRCHKVNGGGGTAGPELSKVAGRLPKEKILESMLNPSAVIAPGYGVASVTLKDGSTVAGVLKAEDDKSLKIQDAEGKEVNVPLDQIASRTPAISSMPPMFALLSKKDIRDLLAYLSTLK